MKKGTMMVFSALLMSCFLAVPAEAKSIENSTYRVCKNDIFIDYDQLNCKKIVTELKWYLPRIEKYKISYLFIGSCEVEKYGEINSEFLTSLGKVVFRQGETMIIEVFDGERGD